MNTPRINIIVAANLRWVIGDDQNIPWHISEDLKRFKRLTLHHPLIMGRLTHESIGRPLPKRTNIILTTCKKYTSPGCLIAHSVQEACDLAQEHDAKEVFIGGGEGVYKALLPHTDRVYLTIVHLDEDGDTRMPALCEDAWEVITHEPMVQAFEDTPAYCFLTLDRIQKVPKCVYSSQDAGHQLMPQSWRSPAQ